MNLNAVNYVKKTLQKNLSNELIFLFFGGMSMYTFWVVMRAEPFRGFQSWKCVLVFIHISDHFEGFRVGNVTRLRSRAVVVFLKVNPDRK